jgi:hypothetical protein
MSMGADADGGKCGGLSAAALLHPSEQARRGPRFGPSVEMTLLVGAENTVKRYKDDAIEGGCEKRFLERRYS